MSSILITGGAGFIGSHVANALAAAGHNVTAFDCLSPQVHGEIPENSALLKSLLPNIRFIKGDVRDRASVISALENNDIILHLAAETGTGQSMYMIEHYTDVNIQGTSLILDVLASQRNNRPRRFVVASSRAIYGEGKYKTDEGLIVYPGSRRLDDLRNGRFEPLDPSTGRPMSPVATDENSPIHPTSIYGITKQVQEQLVMTACPTIGIEPVALRYQNVYGPGQSLTNPYTGILSIFSTRIMQGKDIEIFEDGHESRDFVYIGDVVEATHRALFNDKAVGCVFNVGSGQPISVLRVIKTLVKEFNSSTTYEISGKFRQGDIRHNFADLTKISSYLGFRPQFAFEAGIKAFVEWVRKQGVFHSAYERSLSELQDRGLVISSSSYPSDTGLGK